MKVEIKNNQMEKPCVVVTSISKDSNSVLKTIAKGCKHNNFDFIIIGDKKSPDTFKLNNVKYYSIDHQLESGFQLASKTPFNHYARKNIGYLIAIENNSNVIVDTDDDNIPLDNFWNFNDPNLIAKCIKSRGWVNVYNYFTDKFIWPRGFPIELLHENHSSLFENIGEENVFCPIQQGLADLNPDVDAIYRLTGQLPIHFDKGKKIALSNGSWCAFNSQNTVWRMDAFHLLYLPSYCSFRMTDIWRSYVAQVIAYNYGWSILFYSPTVYQERNPHDLLKDFSDEIPGYLNNSTIMNLLNNVSLSGDQNKIGENMLILYEEFVKYKLIQKQEINLLECWIEDLENLLKKS